MVHRWHFGDFLRLVLSAISVQHVSDLHLKFALRPLHHVWKYSTHPICDREEQARKTRSPAIAEGPRDAGVPVEIW